MKKLIRFLEVLALAMTIAALVIVSSSCGPSPIDLENCFEDEIVVPDGLLQSELLVWMNERSQELRLPRGYDCAEWRYVTSDGIVVGFARLTVRERR